MIRYFPKIFILLGIIGLFMLYSPIVLEEAIFTLRQSAFYEERKWDETPPINDEFSIQIQKLSINTPVISDVDPFDRKSYQQALSLGIAHAQDSVYPGELGTIFLFAHSSVNVIELTKYNAAFYLIHHLKPSDEIKLTFAQNEYLYRVDEVKVVNANDLTALTMYQPVEKLVLSTCWPPGTNFKRLLVEATRI